MLAPGAVIGAGTLTALLGVLSDPAAEAAYRRQLAAEAWHDGFERGYRAGYERGARVLEAEWPAVVAPVLDGRPDHDQVEARRWRVLCRGCRRSGPRDGCGACEARTRETFGAPHRDDLAGRKHG